MNARRQPDEQRPANRLLPLDAGRAPRLASVLFPAVELRSLHRAAPNRRASSASWRRQRRRAILPRVRESYAPRHRLQPPRRERQARPRPQHLRLTVYAVLLVLFGAMMGHGFAASAPGAATSRGPSEQQVKAGVIANLPKYVQWPAAAFPDDSSAVIVAIVGDDQLADEMRRLASSRSGDGRALDVRAIQPNAAPEHCHLLFVAATPQRRSAAMLAATPAGVLTVGEAPDFLAAGGMINLTRRDRKIHLEINLEAAEAAGLKISSKLLGIADVVRGKSR